MNKLQKNTPVPVPMPKQVPVPQKEDETQTRIIIALISVLLFLALLLMLLFFLLKSQNGAGTAGNQSGTGEAAATNTNSDTDGTAPNNDSDTQDTANDNTENSSNNENDGEQNPAETSEQEQTSASHSAEMTGTETKSKDESENENDEEEKTESQTQTSEDKNENKEMVSPSSLVDNLQGDGKNSKEEDKENETDPDSETGNIFSKGDTVISFFGAKGKGSKFVYIIDHSGSMSGTPLEEAKKEMLKGLRMLQPHHKFNIIFYDNKYIVWQTDKKLIAATPKNKQDAERFVNSISAQGGTEPVPAIHEAISYQPQVIFFLTDGQFTMNLDETVNKANKEKIHINIIEFGSGYGTGTQQLKDLARRTNGDYRYVDIGSLDLL
jgi:Mg-chelatase subunit ChlD